MLVRKLGLRGDLNGEDQAAISRLPVVVRDFNGGQLIVREGEKSQYSCLLLSGFAFRSKVAGNGGRQIISIHMKGDFIDLQNSLLRVADHDVESLGQGRVALIPVESIRQIALQHPAVCLALWHETLIEASIFRECMVNIGRRDAHSRIAHLLCELSVRLEIAGLGRDGEFELPLTQEQLADAASLTAVHVNRTLMKLDAEGLIKRSKRTVVVLDWKALAKVAEFNPRYLHIPDIALTHSWTHAG